MDVANYEMIQAMCDDLKKEQKNQRAVLDEKKNKIAEIDTYLNSLLSKEESDLRVFLPRKVEDIYHDVIEQNKQIREKLIDECDTIERQLYLEEGKIERLQKILSDSSLLHVKQLSILDAQERERQRIARDLHDTSLQNLTHLVHKVELGSMYIDKDPVRAKLELATVEKGIRKVIEEIRNSIFDLRPMSVDDLGMKETIEKLLSVLNQDKHFHIMTDIDEIVTPESDSSMSIVYITIYRIIQECVQNSLKHSNGNEIKVKLKNHDKTYLISVEDNGSGFDLNAALKMEKHFGLSVIYERVLFLGGKIDINTQNGTFVQIEIPKCEISR